MNRIDIGHLDGKQKIALFSYWEHIGLYIKLKEMEIHTHSKKITLLICGSECIMNSI